MPSWVKAYDPNKPWWLQGGYAPVTEEVTTFDLQVEGALPPELSGLYVRNGSNPKNAATSHWFLGDGMLHGVRLNAGRAEWYRNRWVQTELLDKPPPDAGLAIPTLTGNASNVSIIAHAGKLLTLGEVGVPYEIERSDLSTAGWYDFDGALMTNMTAHPKLDPLSGELYFFGYNWVEPYLTFHLADPNGTLVRSVPIANKGAAMQHDFALTERNVVFMDLPIVFNLEQAVAGQFPFRWDDAYGARLGVMPRDGGAEDVRWFEMDPCFVFHTMNAHEDNGVISIEAARYDSLWRDGPEDFDHLATLWRFSIDLNADSASASQLDDRAVEFPQLDRRRLTRSYRYGYALRLDARNAPGKPPDPNATTGVIKYDFEGGAPVTYEFHAAETPGELSFVPASDSAAEDEGFLVGYVYDARTDKSDLVVFDATTIASGPIARVKLPARVPAGFHGLWLPA